MGITKKASNKSTKQHAFWLLPVVAVALLVLRYDLGILQHWYGMWIMGNALIAAGITKLLFSALFDELFGKQDRLHIYSDPEHNDYQRKKFSLGWWVFFSLWAMFNFLLIFIP